MWAAIGAWLASTGINDVLNWFTTWITSLIASQKQVSDAHTSDSDQAQQDMNGVEQLPPTPTAEQETNAGNSSMDHL